MSKFSDFLAKQGIDARRVLAASKEIEALRPEDRAIKMEQRQAKEKEEKPAEGGAKPPPKPKPRSGRPVTGLALRKALAGETVSGPAKSRMLRAVNTLLAQKKKNQAALKDLF